MFMHIAYDEGKQGYLAVITDKLPSSLRPDEVITVLTFELLPSREACAKWFNKMRKERPWENGSSRNSV